MLNKKEIIAVLITIIILTFSITLIESWKIFFCCLLSVFVILGINIAAKKIVSFYLDSEIEIKIWELRRFGVKKHQYFKRSFPAGAFLPIISKIIFFPINSFVWMACLIFDVKPKIYRTAKRHGLYSYSEMTEYHLGLIAAAGIFLNLAAAVAGYLLGFPLFARLNIYYAFFNLLPLSELDGNKIFFGNLVIWSFLAVLTLIGLGYAFLLP